MSRRFHGDAVTGVSDQEAASVLLSAALIEIRYLSRRARRENEGASPADDLQRIWFLSDLCHNLPGVTRPPVWQPSRKNAPLSSRERAMQERPMSWTWNTAGPEGRAWIIEQLDGADCPWTPPPPLPNASKGPPELSLRKRLGFPLRWPVQAPEGRQPLPAEARVLKAVDTETVCALFEEARRLRSVAGKDGSWLYAHLDQHGTHYLVPDPPGYYWPGNSNGRGGTIDWWQCAALLCMQDGEQVAGSIRVLPQTFTPLPSTLSRSRQRRLIHLARATERDTRAWRLDHESDCGPHSCGFLPERPLQERPTS
ncbi:hypothetical protein FHU36_003779 [Nonomuraea muscovyensis]|uniref:Uncharacterized protein n=1 Tax=Nonomuraea muscovyensis TaxID=1124761 RepID=A0A7X0C5R7_9ACTN|nr:hypothetical protein [Nonomuraea muscovyensis]MBB6347234.1 hypothetical protein [Nonomuraea muscovyensis]